MCLGTSGADANLGVSAIGVGKFHRRICGIHNDIAADRLNPMQFSVLAGIHHQIVFGGSLPHRDIAIGSQVDHRTGVRIAHGQVAATCQIKEGPGLDNAEGPIAAKGAGNITVGCQHKVERHVRQTVETDDTLPRGQSTAGHRVQERQIQRASLAKHIRLSGCNIQALINTADITNRGQPQLATAGEPMVRSITLDGGGG